MKSTIYTVAQDLTTAISTPLSLGTIVRRYGCGINATGGVITITKPGYYDVDVSATVTNDTTGALTLGLSLTESGAVVTGGTASKSLIASETAALSIASTVRVFCNTNKTLQVVPNIAGVTIDNLAVRVTEV